MGMRVSLLADRVNPRTTSYLNLRTTEIKKKKKRKKKREIKADEC